MLLRILTPLLLGMLTLSCVSPYTQFYRDRTQGLNVRDVSTFEQVDGIDYREGTNPEEETARMIEDGYQLVGQSAFSTTGMVSKSDAFGQAAKVGATVMISYDPKHISSSYGSTSAFVPAGRSSFAFSVPIEYRRYEYLVTYWIKRKTWPFGAYFKDLTQDEKAEQGSNKGVRVVLVVKGTPAYKADILKGDIIKRVDDVEIEDYPQLLRVLEGKMGQTVKVEVVNLKGVHSAVTVHMGTKA